MICKTPTDSHAHGFKGGWRPVAVSELVDVNYNRFTLTHR